MKIMEIIAQSGKRKKMMTRIFRNLTGKEKVTLLKGNLSLKTHVGPRECTK